MYPYSQTNIQLFNQLSRECYSKEELGFVLDAYELAMNLFTSQFRPSGDAFISHLVGTASILASLHLSINVVVAGLLHAAYIHGDFGIKSPKTISSIKRKRLKQALGDEVEEYVSRYTALEWNSRNIPIIRKSLDALDQIDRDVVLMHLANELEDSLNLGVLYCPDAERRKQYIERCGPVMVEMAGRLGFPSLAAELARAFQETSLTEIPVELRDRSGRDRAYIIPPKSYRKRLTVAFCHSPVRILNRSKKLYDKIVRVSRIVLNRG